GPVHLPRALSGAFAPGGSVPRRAVGAGPEGERSELSRACVVHGVDEHQRLVGAVAAAAGAVGDLLRRWRTDEEVCSGVWEGSQVKDRAEPKAYRGLGGRP